jgi:hypothetical protein
MNLGGKMLHRTASRYFICLVIFVATSQLHAQEAKPQPSTSTYKLDYIFSENQDGKRVNARSYTTLVRVRDRGSIRLGSRIPVALGASKEGVTSQFQYMDIGVNIDCRIEEELDSGIDLFTNAEISSLTDNSRVGNPIVRQSKIQVQNIVPLGKQILLTSADEVDGTRRLQLEVTATKVK